MKISFNWLKQYIDLEIDAAAVAEKLTSIGLEVEEVTRYSTIPKGVEDILIGHVKEVSSHPDADKLRITKVDVGGSELLHIVCGAPNVAEGQKVPVATIGTTIYPSGGEPFTIKKAKIRGQLSEGMICAEDEIGIGSSHSGIMVLKDDAQVGASLGTYLPYYTDWIIDIGLTPNRVDAASHIGVARDLAAALGKSIQHPQVQINYEGEAKTPLEVIVEDKEACPRYSGVIVEGVKVAESPQWLQNALRAVGQQPINNIVDITNYVMLESGQPLHAFDVDKIRGNAIIVRKATKGQEFTTLDKVSRKLNGEELLICDNEGAMALAGVFGGLNSGISASTNTIFIESACFDAVTVRKASRSHLLFTEASFRFERGTDPNATIPAMERAASLIVEVTGGVARKPVYDIYPKTIPAAEVKLTHNYLARVAGMEIPKADVKVILQGLEFKILEETDEYLRLEVPGCKVDVRRPIDVVEEVMRIYSFDKVPLKKEVRAVLQADVAFEKERKKKRIASFLAGQGFFEASSLSMLKETENQVANAGEAVKIINPLSVELAEMRTSLLIPGLRNIRHNLNRQQPDVKLYEWGAVHTLQDEQRIQKNMLGLWVTGNILAPNWHTKACKADIYYIKALAEQLMQYAGVQKYNIAASANTSLEDGFAFTNRKGELIGEYGHVGKAVLKKTDISQEVFFLQFDTAFMFSEKPSAMQYQPYSKFPRMERDLALQVPAGLLYEQVKDIIQSSDRKFLRQVSLFDVYQGSQLAEGYKSCGVRLEFEDKEKTLEDKTVDKIMNRITERLEKELNVQIR